MVLVWNYSSYIKSYSGWWFQPLWNILVSWDSWDNYSQYMEKMFQTTNQISYSYLHTLFKSWINMSCPCLGSLAHLIRGQKSWNIPAVPAPSSSHAPEVGLPHHKIWGYMRIIFTGIHPPTLWLCQNGCGKSLFWENPLFLWWCSIVMWNYRRVKAMYRNDVPNL